MKLCLLALFGFLLSSCNSKFADLTPIAVKPPFIKQLGSFTTFSTFNNNGDDFCNKIAVDRFDNIYCAGQTTGSMGKLSDGSQDAFVAKFNRQGDLVWIKQFGSPLLGTDSCNAIGTDFNGNIYCGGVTTKIIAVNTGTVMNKNSFQTYAARADGANDQDGFIAKLDPDGNILWIKQFGSVGWHEGCKNIAVTPAGNVYCAASTSGELGTSPVDGMWEWQGGSQDDVMIGKWDKDGNEIWLRQIATRTQGYYSARGMTTGMPEFCYGIALDSDENVYCAGGTQSNLGDSNGSGLDPFILKLNSNGILQFISQIGNNTATANPSIVGNINANEYCNDITVDEKKNIYCAGDTPTSSFGEASDGSDGFVIKWDPNGNLQWISQMGLSTFLPGFSNAGTQNFDAIKYYSGNLYVMARTTGSTAGTHSGQTDILILKFDPLTGNPLTGQQLGTSVDDFCYYFTFDIHGNLYAGCSTYGSLGEAHSANAGQDPLIFRIKAP